MLHHDKAESHEIKENQSCDSCYLVAVSHKLSLGVQIMSFLLDYAAVITTSCLWCSRAAEHHKQLQHQEHHGMATSVRYSMTTISLRSPCLLTSWSSDYTPKSCFIKQDYYKVVQSTAKITATYGKMNMLWQSDERHE